MDEQTRIINNMPANCMTEEAQLLYRDTASHDSQLMAHVGHATLRNNKALLSTEIVQLFSIVPAFYDYLMDSDGLRSILSVSLRDARIFQAINDSLIEHHSQNVSFRIT